MPAVEDVITCVHGFHVLPLTFPPLSSLPSSATHYLYVGAHTPQIPSESTPRSLFLANVPIDGTEAHLRHLLSLQLGLPHGRVEGVAFEKERRVRGLDRVESAKVDREQRGKKRKRGANQPPAQILSEARLLSTWDRDLQINGGSAIVTFVDKASMDTALRTIAKAIKTHKEILWGKDLETQLPSLGSTRYINHQDLRFPERSALLQSVNAYMNAFSAQEAAQAKLQARQRSEPDVDGFVTVTRGGRIDPARQGPAQALIGKRDSKRGGLENFYRFQTREKKKARAGELIRKFEEDKEKIRKMKEQRGRFKPE